MAGIALAISPADNMAGSPPGSESGVVGRFALVQGVDVPRLANQPQAVMYRIDTVSGRVWQLKGNSMQGPDRSVILFDVWQQCEETDGRLYQLMCKQTENLPVRPAK